VRLSTRFLAPTLLLSVAFSIPRATADDIVDTTARNPNLSTFLTAMKETGLVDTLRSAGPFTVFAPTNDAFAKLPKKGLDAALTNKALLSMILTYHVAPGKVMVADAMKVKNGTRVRTLEGDSVTIKNRGGISVERARVSKADIECDNGVIHVIDTVLIPPDLNGRPRKR